MSEIGSHFKQIKQSVPEHVKMVVVSKFQPISAIEEIYGLGHRLFGESKVQELLSKYETLEKDIEWHFIGHLQTNKVKYIIPFISLIQGVDSLKLLLEINKFAQKNNKIVDCLLQVHIAQEETKFGFSFDELNNLYQSGEINNLKHVRICGLMGMASNTDDTQQVREEFHSLAQFFNQFKETVGNSFQILSMGMSGDYKTAIEEGSNMVRIGSSIFGERNYN